VLIVNIIVVLITKYHTDLNVRYTSGFYSEHVTIWRVFNQTKLHVFDMQFATINSTWN